MHMWKMRRRKNKTEKLSSLGIKVLLPVFLALFGLLFCLILSMSESRKLAKQYAEDTAGLYVEQINKDIFQINNELIQILEKSSIKEIPDSLNSSMQNYYELLNEIKEQNRMMKIRYKEVQYFFVYAKEPDILIGDLGTVFEASQVGGFWKDLREFSREAAEKNYGVTAWEFLELQDNTYIVGWYAKKASCIL